MKIRRVGAELFHADRHDEPIVAIRSLVNASKEEVMRASKGSLARLALLQSGGRYVITRSQKAGGLGLAAVAAKVHVLAKLLTQQGLLSSLGL